MRNLTKAICGFPAALAAAWPAYAHGAIAYALTDDNDLLEVNTAAPQNLLSAGAITGLGGQDLIGIDIRPADGQLYGVGHLGGVFRINTTTRAATLVSTMAADVSDTTSPFAGLSGSRFGFDFNPVPGTLRIISDAEQNLRINVDTGATITDGDLQYGPGQPGATGDDPSIAAGAYTNSHLPSPRSTPGTTLFVLETRENEDRLLIQNPPNNGTLVYVSMLGVDASTVNGFDILFDTSRPVGQENVGYAVLEDTVRGETRLYEIDLTIGLATNSATPLGAIGGGEAIDGLAVAIPEPAAATLFGVASLAVLGRRARRR